MFTCIKCKSTITKLEDIGSSGNKGVYCTSCTDESQKKEKDLINNHIEQHDEEPDGCMLRYLRMIAWGADQT